MKLYIQSDNNYQYCTQSITRKTLYQASLIFTQKNYYSKEYKIKQKKKKIKIKDTRLQLQVVYKYINAVYVSR